MAADYSKGALFRYLETATRQGLLNTNTAGGLRAAATKLLEDLGDQDEVRGVDVDAAAIKYHNKHPGELRPESLGVYRKRVTRLLKQFEMYVANPMGFKPQTRGAAKNSDEKIKGRKESVQRANKNDNSVTTTTDIAGGTPSAPSATATTLAYPFPLRENVLAQIVVPRNLNSEEARRLCAFIMTLAADFKPKESQL